MTTPEWGATFRFARSEIAAVTMRPTWIAGSDSAAQL
jgi:hypothetical protein